LESKLLTAEQFTRKDYTITDNIHACEIYDPVKCVIVVVKMSSSRLFFLKIENIQYNLMV